MMEREGQLKREISNDLDVCCWNSGGGGGGSSTVVGGGRMSLLESDKKLEKHQQNNQIGGNSVSVNGGGGGASTSPSTSSSSSFYSLGSGLLMCSEFVEDQIREGTNFTDLDLICCDGYVQVHRCLLMGASPFLREMLIDKHIMETTAISLPDVQVRHLKQVLSLLYSGKTLIEQSDEGPIFSLLMMLQLLPVPQLLCRPAKETDSFIELRHNEIVDDYQEDVGDGKQEQEESFTMMESNEDNHQVQEEDGTNEEDIPNSPTGLEESVNGEDNVENEDPVQKVACSGAEAGVNGRRISVDSCASKDNKNDKRKSVDTDDIEPEDQEEDCTKNPSFRRLRKRPNPKPGQSQASSPPKKKKAAGKPKKKSKSSKISAGEDFAKETLNESNHDENLKEDDGGGGKTPSASVLPPETQNQDRAHRRLSSVSSISSSTSSSNGNTTAGATTTRVFLETKEIGGVQYNIYGLRDPIKGLQAGKTIAVNASEDKSARKGDGSKGKIS